ncbi:MAG: heavy-metal-associated domain-containing protein [Gaiellaceae bacterium]
MVETRSYRVPGMSCATCTAAIEGEVSQVAGVESVSADLETKLVNVRGERLSDGELRAAIDEAGYEVDDGDA